MKKILIYNWTQFDTSDGGGVTVYIDNIISEMIKDPNIGITFLSSGTKYSLFKKKMFIKKTKNKYLSKVNSYTIYNSKTMFAINQFSRINIYNNDDMIPKLFSKFIDDYGPFDVIHFNNLEGLSLNVLKLKEKYPKTKFIYSMHNYFPICPNVYLWQHNKKNCLDYENGKRCLNCIYSNYDMAIKKLKIRTILERLRINVNSKTIKKLYSNLKKDKPYSECSNSLSFCTNEDYKLFREKNIEYLNKYVDDILCVSKRVAEIAIKYGINKDKCHVSYIGTKFANDLKRQDDIDIYSDTFNLIYLGYMNTMKGFDFLIKAFSKIDKNVAKKINLTLVCRNNPSYDINSIIEKLKKKFNTVVYIDGYNHGSLPEILHGQHLGVIPVVWEDNLPQVSIEITSFGVPILSSNLGGASELCSDPDFKFVGSSVSDFNYKLTNIVNNRQKLLNFWEKYNKPTTMKEHMKELYGYYNIRRKNEKI